MKKLPLITCLFLDIGGVLLTDHFFLLCAHPQARPRHVPAGAGYLPGASPSSRLYRKHPYVRPGRGGFGDSEHSPHGLRVYARTTGFVRIAE